MNDAQVTMNNTGGRPKISELTLAEIATVSGASYAYCPAPTAPALYDDRVFVSSERTGSLF